MPHRRPGPLTLVVLSLLWVLALGGGPAPVHAADGPRLPRVAEGWSIRLLLEAPAVQYPTAAVVAPDGSIFVGQDPRDMPGPVDAPIDSVLLIRPNGSTSRFAEGLNSVMGLEWLDGTLVVVHAPTLSSFRDEDGDGRAERRVDLVTGLGPLQPASSGLNDHIASGVRLGMDGFLYIAVGDKGIPQATGADGKTITLPGGGVVRVRPDGTDLEVVSTGERNPLSVALSDRDEVFTFGNDDDAHLWPNSLTHHIVGGHYGYPFEFRAAPHRALPIVAGQIGGAGAQGTALLGDGLPARFRGNLLFADWGLQAVARYEVEPSGATWRLSRREEVVGKGDLTDFRPLAVVPLADPGSLLVVDWAFSGWLSDGPPTGRLFRLDYTGPDRPVAAPRSLGRTQTDQIAGLAHPDQAIRLAAQRRLAKQGETAVAPLARLLADSAASPTPRVHALWALDAIGIPASRTAVRLALQTADPVVRVQAVRAVGIRRDAPSEPELTRLLADPDAVARREAAIALGRLSSITPATRSALFDRLGEPDPTVAWSVRRAIRQAPPDPADAALLNIALQDPARCDSAVTLVDGWYRPDLVRVLAEIANRPGETAWITRLVAALGGLYGRVPAWSGTWFGPNPAAEPPPKATEPWDEPSRAAIRKVLLAWNTSSNPEVRRQTLIAAINMGPDGVEIVREMIRWQAEDAPEPLVAAVRFLGDQRDERSVLELDRLLTDSARPLAVRTAALDALSRLEGRSAVNARLTLLFAPQSPPPLIAHALPPLGQARLLPSNDLVGFLDHESPVVRAAVLGAFPSDRPLGRGVAEALLLRRDDPSPEVRRALAEAAARHDLRAAVPWLAEAAQGDDPALRTAATRALTQLPDPVGIPALVAALGDRDPDLRRAAVAALTPLRVEARAEVARRAGRGEFQGAGALAAERLLAEFRPVTDWRVIGPLPAATGPLFADSRAIDFGRALPGPEGRSIAWRTERASDDTGTLPLSDAAEGATAFAVAEVASDRDRVALLAIEASGPTIVAVDDRPLAHFGAGFRGETVRVPLRSGTNRVLLRLRRAGGPWWVRVALSEPESPRVVGPATSPEAPVSPSRAGLRAVALHALGDPRRGEALFREPNGVGCARCHAAGGKAPGVAGLAPSLDGLASKYDRAEIIRSILEPSARLAVGYAPTVIELHEGGTVTGLVRGERPDGSVAVVDGDGRVRVVPGAAVERREPGRVSTMPEGLVDNLKPIEFTDLVVYLLSLRASNPEPVAPR